MTKATETKTITEHAKLIAGAKAKGYAVKATYVECPGCNKLAEEYMATCGLTTRPSFINTKTAIKFGKKGCEDIIACPDGHRTRLPKPVYMEKAKCKAEDCNVVIGQVHIDDNDGYCYKCRPYTETSTDTTSTVGKPSTAQSNIGHAPKPSTKEVVM